MKLLEISEWFSGRAKEIIDPYFLVKDSNKAFVCARQELDNFIIMNGPRMQQGDYKGQAELCTDLEALYENSKNDNAHENLEKSRTIMRFLEIRLPHLFPIMQYVIKGRHNVSGLFVELMEIIKHHRDQLKISPINVHSCGDLDPQMGSKHHHDR